MVKEFKFKQGDRVRISEVTYGYYGEVGTVMCLSRTDRHPYQVMVDNLGWSKFLEDDLELIEEETSMKFKVGDKVQVVATYSAFRGDKGNVTGYDFCKTFPYTVEFEDGDCVFHGKDLIALSTEEEKVMKFKVGDKVKVSNSWEGHDGATGQIVDINVYNEFTHEVRFEDMGAECFREEELELVKSKQSFTKSDLKTGMGVVLRDGSKGHVLVDTGCVDVIRFLENGNYSCLNDFSDDLTSNFKQQHDIAEVYFTEYQFKLFTEGVFEHDCVFKREPEPEPKPEPEPTKMTMKEINEHFGKPIEIVE